MQFLSTLFTSCKKSPLAWQLGQQISKSGVIIGPVALKCYNFGWETTTFSLPLPSLPADTIFYSSYFTV
jgi:hypothetical protein